MNLIQTQVCRIIIRQNHMNHRTTAISYKHDANKRNSSEKGVTTTLLKIAPSSQPNYLRLHTILRSHNSNWISICVIIQVIVGLPSNNSCWITIYVSDKLAYNSSAKDIFLENIQFIILCI